MQKSGSTHRSIYTLIQHMPSLFLSVSGQSSLTLLIQHVPSLFLSVSGQSSLTLLKKSTSYVCSLGSHAWTGLFGSGDGGWGGSRDRESGGTSKWTLLMEAIK